MARHADVSAARRTRLAPRRTGSIAERLAYLFDVVHAPGTRGYTAAEVARGVRAAGGSISDVYINKLLNGQRGEPSLRYLRMLAGFFGVPLTFFLDDDPDPIDGPGLDLQIRLRNPQVQAMLAAAGRLPESAQSALGDIVTSLLRAEGREPAVEPAVEPADPDDPDNALPALIAAAARLSPESVAAVGAIIDKLGAAATDGRSAVLTARSRTLRRPRSTADVPELRMGCERRSGRGRCSPSGGQVGRIPP